MSKNKGSSDKSRKGPPASDSGGIKIVALNKKARFEYEIIQTEEAGVVLSGAEVKAIRAGQLNITESYVRVVNSELFLLGCRIEPYSHSTDPNYDPSRQRKLLMKRKEIEKLAVQQTVKGLTLLPLKVYLKKGLVKIEIGVGRGKKLHDKREDIKRREAERALARAMRR